MSGGGGGGPWRPEGPAPDQRDEGGGAGGDSRERNPEDPCAIFEKTALNSPDRTVLSTLRTGDQLAVVFDAGPPRRLLAQTNTGSTAGSITSASMLRIIRCISNGREYVADVLSVRGAICEVQIRPR